jgi:hypothetical protein
MFHTLGRCAEMCKDNRVVLVHARHTHEAESNSRLSESAAADHSTPLTQLGEFTFKFTEAGGPSAQSYREAIHIN